MVFSRIVAAIGREGKSGVETSEVWDVSEYGPMQNCLFPYTSSISSLAKMRIDPHWSIA